MSVTRNARNARSWSGRQEAPCAEALPALQMALACSQMRSIKAGIAGILGLVMALLVAPIASAATVIIRHGPHEGPPAIVEEHPAPRDGYIWVNGHHAYRHRHYIWVRGHYVRERPGWEYVPGHWDRHEDHYDWYRGEWHPYR